MALDLTTFADLFTFSRSGTATYLDSNGVLQTAADGVARTAAYRYVGGVLTGPSLRLESAVATNLVTYSEDFTDASWVVTGITVNGNNAKGPDGVATSASTLTSSGSSTNRIRINVNGTGACSYSVFAKAGSGDFIQLVDSADAEYYANFDLGSGAVGTSGTKVSTNIEHVGNGWYRCSMTTDGSTAGSSYMVYIVNSASAGFGASSTSPDSVLIFGAQLETGSIPTSYIPTSGATATRSAETLTIAAADMPTYFGTTDAVCFQMSGTMNYADTGNSGEAVWLRWLADANNYIQCRLRTDAAYVGAPWFLQSTSGVGDAPTVADAYSPGLNVAFNIASRHGSSFVNGAVDGTVLTENNTPTAIADLSAADFEVGYAFNGHIDQLLIWNQDIGDAGIAEASQ